MENKKKIKIGVIINENDYHVSAELPAEEARYNAIGIKLACLTASGNCTTSVNNK